MKYTEFNIAMREIPDEVCLALNISNCPYHCKGCHSPELWKDEGIELTYKELDKLITKYLNSITCILFMGDSGNSDNIIPYATYIKKNYPNLKVALYTGQKNYKGSFFLHEYGISSLLIDYIKVGPWNEELGTLVDSTTNQTLYRVNIEQIKI